MPLVTISPAQMRQRFHGCTPDYIANVCHSACCNAPSRPSGVFVAITERERPAIELHGAVVTGGLLQPRPGERVCPFKTDDYLCGLHHTPDKPIGCIASPFTLTNRDTVIVRNRYRLLRCYRDDRDGPAPPAYVAFGASLDRLFGQGQAQLICAILDRGDTDKFMADMDQYAYDSLKDNTHTRREAS
jgi:hypothetical protein